MLFALIAAGAGLAVLGNYLIPLFVRLRQIRIAATRGKGYLCLTYDDGPDDILTEALVELLEEKLARATFFLVGFRADRNREICRTLAATTHEIGCHTFRHARPWRQLPWKALADVRRGYREMALWLSPHAPFRPPRGKTHLLIMSWLFFKGIKVIWWTIDSGDTWSKLPDTQETIDRVKRDRGGMVLMHSFHKDAVRQDYVLKMTRRLIDLARDEGFVLCTASEYLEAIS